MTKPSNAQMELLTALSDGSKRYSTWGGKTWTATPARASLPTIDACVKTGWVKKEYLTSEIKLSLTDTGWEFFKP